MLIFQQDRLFWYAKAIPNWVWSNWSIFTQSIYLGYRQWNMLQIFLALADKYKTKYQSGCMLLSICFSEKNLKAFCWYILLLYSAFKFFLEGRIIERVFRQKSACAGTAQSFSVFWWKWRFLSTTYKPSLKSWRWKGALEQPHGLTRFPDCAEFWTCQTKSMADALVLISFSFKQGKPCRRPQQLMHCKTRLGKNSVEALRPMYCGEREGEKDRGIKKD